MNKKNKVSLVLTTINKVSKNILNIEKGCKKKGWELQIVGDNQSPKNFTLKYGIYTSLSDQLKLDLNYPKKSTNQLICKKKCCLLTVNKKWFRYYN